MVAITSEETEIEVLQCPVENTISLQDSDGDYDQEEEEDDEEEVPVTLGFVEILKNPNSLLPQFFPSKAGGTPAWLDPVDLPSEKSRTCGIYQHQQWKRCPEKQCRSVKVLRCQLPRSNAYYSSEPPKLDKANRSPRVGAALCNWCGTWKGDKVCGRCWNIRYCSREHQVILVNEDILANFPRPCMSSQFSESSTSNGKITPNQEFLWLAVVANNVFRPEFEIFNEDEAEYEYYTEVSENDYSSSLVLPKQKDEAVEAMMGDFEGDDDRRSWTTFQVRVGKAPEKYTQDSKEKPLWSMASGRPSKADIPKCNYCDGPLFNHKLLRIFCFLRLSFCLLTDLQIRSICIFNVICGFCVQILPQLLYFFGVKNDVNSLDWATIAVYTCVDSCETNVAYKEEFAWVQLNSQTTTQP
ncbi:hypothetical protein MKW98_007120 [Papaver atlanticum]|uniref:Programmed cell death protein 2 C-terminal domain-containing protein n=1 Tax=Papaver atlanticum TaxID=357466 RepID=A0AAD4XI88_9MAGN|nr:hypothetical protein MKW98_007120 [Papaver atlanticum]